MCVYNNLRFVMFEFWLLECLSRWHCLHALEFLKKFQNIWVTFRLFKYVAETFAKTNPKIDIFPQKKVTKIHNYQSSLINLVSLCSSQNLIEMSWEMKLRLLIFRFEKISLFTLRLLSSSTISSNVLQKLYKDEHLSNVLLDRKKLAQ